MVLHTNYYQIKDPSLLIRLYHKLNLYINYKCIQIIIMNNVINVNIVCINIKAKQRIFGEIWGKKLITSAYHPQTCQTLCERVNATVKVIYYFDICM